MTRRRGRSFLLLATAGTVAAVAAPVPVLATSSSGRPARILVYAQEWSLWPSRTALPAGHVIVQLWNRGEDAHDLRIRRLDSHGKMVGRTQGVRVTRSGALSEATWRLPAGRYELYCSMPQHLKLGMHVKLRVR